MASALLTQVVFWTCVVIFGRLFTYQRGDARFRRGVSILATVVMGCAGVTVIYILKGELRLPAQGWPLAVLLLVFAAAVIRSGGNLAGVLRPEPGPVWTGAERRRPAPPPRPPQGG